MQKIVSSDKLFNCLIYFLMTLSLTELQCFLNLIFENVILNSYGEVKLLVIEQISVLVLLKNSLTED